MSATFAMVDSVYDRKYNDLASSLEWTAKAMAEGAGTTVNAVAATSGEQGVQALFDVLIDNGYRAVLVNALNSPNIEKKHRERLLVILYGTGKQTPVLFAHLH